MHRSQEGRLPGSLTGHWCAATHGQLPGRQDTVRTGTVNLLYDSKGLISVIRQGELADTLDHRHSYHLSHQRYPSMASTALEAYIDGLSGPERGGWLSWRLSFAHSLHKASLLEEHSRGWYEGGQWRGQVVVGRSIVVVRPVASRQRPAHQHVAMGGSLDEAEQNDNGRWQGYSVHVSEQCHRAASLGSWPSEWGRLYSRELATVMRCIPGRGHDRGSGGCGHCRSDGTSHPPQVQGYCPGCRNGAGSYGLS